MTKIPTLYFVVPCYNEEKVLSFSKDLFVNKLKFLIDKNKVNKDSKILFVDDGSSDRTWEMICDFSEENNSICGISQSKNRGQQSSILAGLMEVKNRCDISITMDCDGQDDIEAVDEMIENYLNGYDVVYGVRNNRDSDSFFKKNSALLFYKMMNKLGAPVIYNHAEYRLVSSKVLNAFSDFNEVNLFLRGMFPLVGFKSIKVFYKREERIAGSSHYSFIKMLNLAIDGITSLSSVPLKLISITGIVLFIISLIKCIGSLYFLGQIETNGLILFIGSIQIIALGIIGEYISKIYMETKHRPRYIISEKTRNLGE